MLVSVTSLGIFVQERLHLCGLKSQNQIYEVAGLHPKTQRKVFAAESEADLGTQQFGTLQTLANAMKFATWREFLKAWQDDDVGRGLPPATIREARGEVVEPRTMFGRPLTSAPALPADITAVSIDTLAAFKDAGLGNDDFRVLLIALAKMPRVARPLMAAIEAGDEERIRQVLQDEAVRGMKAKKGKP